MRQRQSLTRFQEAVFQSTHPRGVRLGWLIRTPHTSAFQSTHPRGVRRYGRQGGEARLSFNPRTHEGCDDYETKIIVLRDRFNPRTHEGCDCMLLTGWLAAGSFNPRTHEGCDQNTQRRITCFLVSIHAPTRGATIKGHYEVVAIKFQSTHPRGVRRRKVLVHRTTYQFQSTHPRGVRLSGLQEFRRHTCFNPRTHEGCDFPHAQVSLRNSVSIHAPTRGATGQ